MHPHMDKEPDVPQHDQGADNQADDLDRTGLFHGLSFAVRQ